MPKVAWHLAHVRGTSSISIGIPIESSKSAAIFAQSSRGNAEKRRARRQTEKYQHLFLLRAHRVSALYFLRPAKIAPLFPFPRGQPTPLRRPPCRFSPRPMVEPPNRADAIIGTECPFNPHAIASLPQSSRFFHLPLSFPDVNMQRMWARVRRRGPFMKTPISTRPISGLT